MARRRTKPTTPVAPYRQTKLARKVRRNRRNAAQLTAPAKPNGCQHPKSRARGMCQCKAITAGGQPVEFDIPATYQPATRHANQPALPPKARLCTQHRFLVEAHAAGDTGSTKDFAHRSQCAVCQHPHRKMIENDWIRWDKTGTEAAEYLDVSPQTWSHHCQYYNLDEKHLDSKNAQLHLAGIAERGGRGKASASDAIRAHEAISKLRGDPVNVNARVLTADVSESTVEMLRRNAELIKRLEALQAAAGEDE